MRFLGGVLSTNNTHFATSLGSKLSLRRPDEGRQVTWVYVPLKAMSVNPSVSHSFRSPRSLYLISLPLRPSTMLMKSSFALLGALVALPMVYASLYPTFPTQESVIPAGQDVVIRWKDDSHSPHLDKLGLLRVDLFLDNDAVSEESSICVFSTGFVDAGFHLESRLNVGRGHKTYRRSC